MKKSKKVKDNIPTLDCEGTNLSRFLDHNGNYNPIAHFNNIVGELSHLYNVKNHDYGNAFGDTIDKAGIGYAVGVLLVKANRFATISSTGELQVNESAIDTLNDIANYAIMIRMYLEHKQETNG